jgi:acyl-ACP thioesterase
MDARGRPRLDAVARFLQDVAIDDVQETDWGMPEHLWFVRRIRVDVLRPFEHGALAFVAGGAEVRAAVARIRPLAG